MAQTRRRRDGGGSDRSNDRPEFQGGRDRRDDGNDRRRRRKGARGALSRRARRDVRLSYRPYLNQLRRTRRQGLRDYEQADERVQNAYAALASQLAPMAGQLQSSLGGVSGDLQAQLAQLAGNLGSSVEGVPASEIGAGANLFGALGAGGLEQIASQGARGALYQDSAQRQGSIEQMITQRNMAQDQRDFLDDLRQQKLDTLRGMPAEIRSRLDFLRDQAFQNNLALRQFGLQQGAYNAQQSSDAALAWLLGQLSGRDVIGI